MMRERRQLVAMWQEGRADTLVTLVRAEGSSYRSPGARLLTGVGAAYVGTVSGGCLETEVAKKASWMTRAGAVVERYAMSFDDSAEIPFGLGCGGTVDLLFEPAATPEAEALLRAMQASLAGEPGTVISFLPGGGRGLRRLILDAQEAVLFASPTLSADKIACARGLVPGQAYEGRFVERLEPPQRLFCLGAGDDAKPLVEMAALLGWEVVVADGRRQLATRDRFAQASAVRGVADWEQALDSFNAGERDAVILMTHSYEQDRELLLRVLPRRPRYLGLLGSRHRSSLLVSEAAAELGWTVEACCERLFAPVGMDLGGDGPEAIALAIVAEVQAVCSGKIRPDSPMATSRLRAGRLSAEEVALQIAKGGSSRYLQAQCALNG